MHKILVFCLFTGLIGCKESDQSAQVVPVVIPKLEFVQPAHFPVPTYPFASNAITQEGAELGRALFNEGLLSSN